MDERDSLWKQIELDPTPEPKLVLADYLEENPAHDRDIDTANALRYAAKNKLHPTCKRRKSFVWTCAEYRKFQQDAIVSQPHNSLPIQLYSDLCGCYHNVFGKYYREIRMAFVSLGTSIRVWNYGIKLQINRLEAQLYEFK